MKDNAGFKGWIFVWVMILMHSSDGVHLPKEHPLTMLRCRPKPLVALTKTLVKESLTIFDEANGKHLPPWMPGFPELHVPNNGSKPGSAVQCSLLFMAQALEEVLEDQRNDLNPYDVSLHKKLKETILMVNMLKACMKEIWGGHCSKNPQPPKMPLSAMEKKQWGHTLLKDSGYYLDWLVHEIKVQMSKARGSNGKNPKTAEQAFARYLEGSGYFL
ncbi:uncharacterized protein LOC130111405 [Lampris incognitus]|uniref:uncharacterized protein LOC130111405 n=1 Tax=Lampris incognitus TaxID=2546036 RepID=UPI0024B4C265|nr:uncharacterized protein LOC130111405 [Lampris incognitus]